MDFASSICSVDAEVRKVCRDLPEMELRDIQMLDQQLAREAWAKVIGSQL